MTSADARWDAALRGAPIADPTPPAARSVAVPKQSSFRPDIQGLRSVAVVLVILDHAAVTTFSGGYIGVDVFFVISGFLITSNITRQLAGPDRFSLFAFYANRARRLLPAAFVAIAATCVLTFILLPASRFDSIARDGLASAYYAVNWRLSAQSVDYLAQDQAPSPFQHFWSLSVEEQYYLVWPLLLLIASAIVIRNRARRRIAFAVALTVVLVPSLIYSISLTASDPSQAYFVTPTRMWELALGGGLALIADACSRIPRIAAAVLGWAGLAAIVYSALVFSGGTPFPGSAALLPTLGAVAVIATGVSSGPFGPALLLSRRVPVWIGDISYSLYLWHWPLIVFTAAQFSGALPTWAGLLAGFGAIIPAWLSYRLVEQPGLHAYRFESTRAGLGLGALSSLSAALAALLLLAFIPDQHFTSITIAANGNAVDVGGKTVRVGAEVLANPPRNDPAGAPRDRAQSIVPDPLKAKQDAPTGGKCIQAITKSSDLSCRFGDTGSSTTVELVGDSHALQWQPALNASGLFRHWNVVTHTKAACPYTTASVVRGKTSYRQCDSWNRAVTASILKEHPSLVIVSATVGYQVRHQGSELSVTKSIPDLAKGYAQAWATLRKAGIRVAVLADTPQPGYDIVGCVQANRAHLTKCARPRSAMIARSALSVAAHSTAGARAVDLNDAICPTSRCAAVIGGVLVYRDFNHVSGTYMSTLSRRFAAAFAPLVASQ